MLKNDLPEGIINNVPNVLKKGDGVCLTKQFVKKKIIKKDDLVNSKKELIEKLRASGKIKNKPKSLNCIEKSKDVIENNKEHVVSGIIQKIYKGTKEKVVAEFEKEFGIKATYIDGGFFNRCNGCDYIFTPHLEKIFYYDNKFFCKKCKEKIDNTVKNLK